MLAKYVTSVLLLALKLSCCVLSCVTSRWWEKVASAKGDDGGACELAGSCTCLRVSLRILGLLLKSGTSQEKAQFHEVMRTLLQSAADECRELGTQRSRSHKSIFQQAHSAG